MVKNKLPIRMSKEYIISLKKLQGKIKAMNGNEPSLGALGDLIIRTPAFKDVEDQILKMRYPKTKFGLKFDR